MYQRGNKKSNFTLWKIMIMTMNAHQNLWYVARTVLGGNFIALSALFLKKKDNKWFGHSM